MEAEWLGYVAGTLTTVAYIPQLIKVLRYKDTKALSLWMYLIVTTGIGLWAVYGVMIDNIPLVLFNSVAFVIASAIIAMKLRHG